MDWTRSWWNLGVSYFDVFQCCNHSLWWDLQNVSQKSSSEAAALSTAPLTPGQTSRDSLDYHNCCPQLALVSWAGWWTRTPEESETLSPAEETSADGWYWLYIDTCMLRNIMHPCSPPGNLTSCWNVLNIGIDIGFKHRWSAASDWGLVKRSGFKYFWLLLT